MSDCAASALELTGTVELLAKLADEVYRVRVRCPEMAEVILPGQFLMLRMPGMSDPLLGRPFALYDTYEESGQVVGLDIGFHVVGKMTGLMEQLVPGAVLELWGPLGNGFPVLKANHLIQVAGGIGYTPFVGVSREALLGKKYGSPAWAGIEANKATLIYGVREARFAANMDDLSDLSELDIVLCTEDGSAGRSGLVTEPLAELIAAEGVQPPTVLTCGPLRMMRAVAELCEQHQVPCYASLETPMACGFGACFSCVVPIAISDTEWDYRRSCLEGPVFETSRLRWDQMM